MAYLFCDCPGTGRPHPAGNGRYGIDARLRHQQERLSRLADSGAPKKRNRLERELNQIREGSQGRHLDSEERLWSAGWTAYTSTSIRPGTIGKNLFLAFQSPKFLPHVKGRVWQVNRYPSISLSP
jgi:hypothetical protein